MSIHDPPLNEQEKALIVILRNPRNNWSYQQIADNLNDLYSEYNHGTRHRNTIYLFMIEHRKKQMEELKK